MIYDVDSSCSSDQYLIRVKRAMLADSNDRCGSVLDDHARLAQVPEIQHCLPGQCRRDIGKLGAECDGKAEVVGADRAIRPQCRRKAATHPGKAANDLTV